jgi:hypothetical protein
MFGLERRGANHPAHAATDEAPAHPPSAVLSLKQAMRRARFDDAERASVVSDLRAARIGRLEVLREALKPVIAQIPEDVDCFDVGLMPGANPRLFIDMIGFVEMARDQRVYTFIQDTRHGRVKLAESASVDAIVEAVTQYIAHRLLERDKAIAAEAVQHGTAFKAPPSDDVARRDPGGNAPVEPLGATAPGGRASAIASMLGAGFAFLIDVLGSIAFFTIIAFAAWFAWSSFNH